MEWEQLRQMLFQALVQIQLRMFAMLWIANINEWIQLQLEINTVFAEYDTQIQQEEKRKRRREKCVRNIFFALSRFLIFWTWNFILNENISLFVVCISLFTYEIFCCISSLQRHTRLFSYKLFASFEFYFSHQYAISRATAKKKIERNKNSLDSYNVEQSNSFLISQTNK